MALRVAIAHLNMRVIGARPSVLRINNSLSRMKHFNSDSPLSKHAKTGTSTPRLIGVGVTIGAGLGIIYSYFSDSERKLPGAIVNTPTQVPMLETLPPGLKVTREV